MKRNAKTRVGAVDVGDSGLTAPGLPQSITYENGKYVVIDDKRWSLDEQSDIIVHVDQLHNSVTSGDTITVYFGDAPPQYWYVESDTNPPYDAPYPFLFKAGELPDGLQAVYYTVQNSDSIGGGTSTSPKVSVTVVNSPDREGVIVDHIGTPVISPNNAPPGGKDGILVTVFDGNSNEIPNAWVAFYGPAEATIDPPVTQTDENGQAQCTVSYPIGKPITVDIWSGRKFQDANPVFGSSEGYSLGLQAAPDDQTAYADGGQSHKAMAVVKYGGVLATDPGQQQLVNFSLPEGKSATFTNDQRHIQVKSQGGYAKVAFTDRNELGETVDLNAKFDDSDLAPPAPPLPFTFKPVWELDLSKKVDGSPPDGTPDKAVATVSKDGQSAGDGTLVEFKLDKSSSATFAKNIPNIQSWGEKLIIVATSGGTAEAWFVDGKTETATLTSALLQEPGVRSNPPALQFKFAVSGGNAGWVLTPHGGYGMAGWYGAHGKVVVTFNDEPVEDGTIVKFKVDGFSLDSKYGVVDRGSNWITVKTKTVDGKSQAVVTVGAPEYAIFCNVKTSLPSVPDLDSVNIPCTFGKKKSPRYGGGH